MKKALPAMLLLCFAVIQTALAQQPTLTAATTNFNADMDVYKINTDSFNVGPSGANQSWNFSNLPGQADTVKYYIREITGGMLNSNYVVVTIDNSSNPVYTYGSYYITGANALEYAGASSDGGFGTSSYEYTNTKTVLKYPFTFQDSFVDTFAYNTGASADRVGNGTVAVEADAYGTVVTPAGTYQNVLRVKSITDKTEIILSDSSVVKSREIEYNWYQPGTSTPVLTRTEFGYVGPNGYNKLFSYGSYLYRKVAGTNGAARAPVNVQLFPNPASGAFTLQYELKQTGKVKITLLNMLGQEVKVLEQGEQAPGLQSGRYDLSSVAKGTYLLRLTSGQDVVTKRLVLN